MTYEFGRIARLAESLQKFGIPDTVAAKIMEGAESILRGTDQRKKAEWIAAAMNRIDELLDEDTKVAVREACACSLGGKRHQIARQIAKNNATLEDRVKAAPLVRPVKRRQAAMHFRGVYRIALISTGRPASSQDRSAVRAARPRMAARAVQARSPSERPASLARTRKNPAS